MIDVKGKTLPLSQNDYQSSDWLESTGSLGEAAVELLDVANALESQNEDWFHGCKEGIPDYYRKLAQRLVVTQQILFGYNVTGNPEIANAKEATT